ncbi:patatin-like phospholipase family protein [Sphingomonas naphthae]|uniref:Patatin-like phospholipase family protein n=1 Tax=Sphingomonas naphthae TaxID=1813468 RepID=A0ABY7TMU6_9SPHN|nr:patatin-like phospholipase family protein [Sphingomonas naphthae]WCT74316.1 patatin-like phospholipase family protein [Sphingomonas naphthae]
MAEADRPHRRRSAQSDTALPLPDTVALVLQGGGALGSFQAGVYDALSGAGIEVDWVAGISIGAVNAAIIAGNPPEQRVAKLKTFWDRVGSGQPAFPIWNMNDLGREWLHEWSAGLVTMTGVPGMFAPRFLPPNMMPPGCDAALSFYDTTPLRKTLDELVDWDLLNSGKTRLSVGAVEIKSGNFRFFDTTRERIDARHIMASGALPPGLPPVEIDGCHYWDGGLVSNTPLAHVLGQQPSDLLVFQVDLFSASNELPTTIMDVMARAKEIQFSSRTRQVSSLLLKQRNERQMVARLLDKLPPEMAEDADVKALRELTRDHSVNLVQLIYRANAWEGGSRDYEFSARTMAEHMAAGRAAVADTMTHSGLLARNILDGQTASFDLTRKP